MVKDSEYIKTLIKASKEDEKKLEKLCTEFETVKLKRDNK